MPTQLIGFCESLNEMENASPTVWKKKCSPYIFLFYLELILCIVLNFFIMKPPTVKHGDVYERQKLTLVSVNGYTKEAAESPREHHKMVGHTRFSSKIEIQNERPRLEQR